MGGGGKRPESACCTLGIFFLVFFMYEGCRKATVLTEEDVKRCQQVEEGSVSWCMWMKCVSDPAGEKADWAEPSSVTSREESSF